MKEKLQSRHEINNIFSSSSSRRIRKNPIIEIQSRNIERKIRVKLFKKSILLDSPIYI